MPAMFDPSICIVPWSGARSPERSERRVDFPDPDGHITLAKVPEGSEKSRSLKIVTVSFSLMYNLERFLSSIMLMLDEMIGFECGEEIIHYDSIAFFSWMNTVPLVELWICCNSFEEEWHEWNTELFCEFRENFFELVSILQSEIERSFHPRKQYRDFAILEFLEDASEIFLEFLWRNPLKCIIGSDFYDGEIGFISIEYPVSSGHQLSRSISGNSSILQSIFISRFFEF
ncbi:MAG: hypothetical protein ACOYN2_02225 [Patescibacteria group bacterium]